MNSQHTPGPWIIFPPDPGETADGKEEGFIHGWLVYSEATNDAICEFATLAGSGHEYDNAEANARVIAALPDLLVACEAIVFAARLGDPAAGAVAATLAAAAIAKTEGTNP